ncbi:hypothetical protein D3C85_951190 [compost metagenome]
MRESLDFLTQHFICTILQCGGAVILFCSDCDDEISLCPLAVFELVLQLLKRNLESLRTMSQSRLVILDFRLCSPAEPSQIAGRAPKLVVVGLESQ